MDIGMPELVVVLVIVLLIFGVGRLGRIGGELGQAIKGFRSGLTDQPAAATATVDEPAAAVAVLTFDPPADPAPAPEAAERVFN